MTVFIDLEDLLYHTFIYDENFGFMADPASKDPEFKVLYGTRKQPIHVYMRDGWEDFLKFLRDRRDIIEPILYTGGQKDYSSLILDILDPERDLFDAYLF
mmetsp:Transcript_6789/g.6024  ORF Transcript_6789/g.6024 Transcript_6789/m.6024 type:complete len:100 (+) Transcript_6789:120-419(+)